MSFSFCLVITKLVTTIVAVIAIPYVIMVRTAVRAIIMPNILLGF